MHIRFYCLLLIIPLSLADLCHGQSADQQNDSGRGARIPGGAQSSSRLPTDVILVKGAAPSASDSITPVPEGGEIANGIFTNKYFRMTYPLPPGWVEKYAGPPPSDSGRYVLAQFSPGENFAGPARGTVLITAQDMFFTPLPAANAMEFIHYSKDNLQADYKVEVAPRQIEIAGRPFAFFAYWSPVAELHWYDLATQVRCHIVEFVLTSRDKKLLETLVREMGSMKLPTENSSTAGTSGHEFPECVKDYATGENAIARVDPVLTEHRFNPVPVRIIIDKEGNVKHIHFLNAFPDQANAIGDALRQWKFKPYLRDGKPVEVETGIMFGRSVYPTASASRKSPVE
jgi:hypothetical protein